MKFRPLLLGFALLFLTAGLAISGMGSVQASSVACGDQIVSDTTLESNLYCESTALHIGASGVTLDLNGYTIEGGDVDHGVIAGDFTDIIIKNGAISGFMEGIGLYGVKNVLIKQITLRGQGDDSIQVFDSQGIVIADVQTSLPLPNAGSSIALINNEDVYVRNVNATGGLYGLLSEVMTNVYVAKSSFTNPRGLGIRLIRNDDAFVFNNTVVGATGCSSGIDIVDRGPTQKVRILSNVVTGCDVGVLVETSSMDPPSENIAIRNNRIHANDDGILLIGLLNSNVERNRLHFNNAGIVLLGDSSNNRIARNIVTGNHNFDMFEDTSGSNTWENNTCQVSNGGAIDCP